MGYDFDPISLIGPMLPYWIYVDMSRDRGNSWEVVFVK